MLTHTELTSLLVFVFAVFSRGQDAIYQSLQSVVDWFREVVGIPMEKKYNTVLFGGMSD